jgi:hypothetical protein
VSWITIKFAYNNNRYAPGELMAWIDGDPPPAGTPVRWTGDIPLNAVHDVVVGARPAGGIWSLYSGTSRFAREHRVEVAS